MVDKDEEKQNMVLDGKVEVSQPLEKGKEYQHVSGIKWTFIMKNLIVLTVIIILFCKSYLFNGSFETKHNFERDLFARVSQKTSVKDKCRIDFCYNGGTCFIDVRQNPECICKNGHYGKYCEYSKGNRHSLPSKNSSLKTFCLNNLPTLMFIRNTLV